MPVMEIMGREPSGVYKSARTGFSKKTCRAPALGPGVTKSKLGFSN